MATQEPPPSYNDLDSPNIQDVGSGLELPTYSRESTSAVSPALSPSTAATGSSSPAAPEPKEYSYEIKNRKGQPWTTLTLLADPRVSGATATFFEGSKIAGSIKLNLHKQDPIQSIVIYIRGDLVISGEPDERTNFLAMRKILWSTSMGDPRSEVASSDTWGEKLKGVYYWPFSIEIPQYTNAVDGEEERFRLPHSFTERFLRPCTEYYLELRITRGKFRSDDRLLTAFGYFSMQRPEVSSSLRQFAYRNNSPIPGPYSDPDGWHALQPVQIRGTIFGKRAVDAKCTVFLAKPLCYTRGSIIPCAMTIETDDTQAADILSSITSSAVYLQRSVRCDFGGSANIINACGQATWWPSADGAFAPDAPQRHIMGEVHLRKDLQPSSAIKNFRVEYAIVVFPVTAVAFKPESSSPLITQSVQIVTCYTAGPRPRSSTPPVYETDDAIVKRYYNSL
ncbi:hypothetical protein C8J57DRAFT_362650 [Mycena rebaudengoi]|nr:hypothetical protein C8J57DRAFT_362650 [Mycena rebaudengoi]